MRNSNKNGSFDFRLFSGDDKDKFAGIELNFPLDRHLEISFNLIADLVIRVSAAQLEMDPLDIKLESRYQQDLDADSLDLVEINMALERLLEISVPDYCIGFIITVEDAALIIHTIVNGFELPEEWDPDWDPD